ncbi:Eae-like protein [Salmonella enterica subsp. enterica]|nr:Eae-like protein [Salmonella enterica subsp. enterica serovar Hvittingfoss]MLV53155.1 Eae-like protein [Salmonella enterica subsp. enterica serovar Hvittingfoss]
MKEVKIYTIVSDQLSPPITGESFCTDMVRHSDYAELEAKYAVLTVDNDKAMESLKQADAVVKLAHEKFSALAAENAALKKSEIEFNDYCRHECEDVGDTWVDDFTETPDTDAFLAEVQAQGVEMFSEKFGGGTLLSNMVKEVAADFTAKLRKGAAQ